MTLDTQSLPPEHLDLAIEKQTLDIQSPRIQMILAGAVLLIVCLLNYSPTLHCGLLQNDYLRMDVIIRATHGDWHDFSRSFMLQDLPNIGRPIGNFTLFLDFMIWRRHWLGFHLTNILLLYASSLLVMLITLELTGTWGNRARVAAAAWAGLLFAVYPLHAETVAWLSCRDHLVSSVLFLSSVFCFLRFSLVREREYREWFFLFFSLQAWQSDSAVVLPAVLLLYLALIPRQYPTLKTATIGSYLKQDLSFALSGWLVVFACLAYKFRIFELGIDLPQMYDWGQANFPHLLDGDSFRKVVFPINESASTAGMFALVLMCAPLILSMVLPIFRGSKELPWLRSFLFCAGWFGLCLLPVCAHWHIYANLVGGASFFRSSAPFCIAIAVGLIPGTDVLPRKFVSVLSVVGAIVALALFLVWSYDLQENLAPWREAGHAAVDFKAKLDLLTKDAAHKVVVTDIPHDYQGVPLCTKESVQLESTLPFSPHPANLSVIDTFLGGSPDYVWPDEIKRAAKDARLYFWSESAREFEMIVPTISQSSPDLLIGNFMAAKLDPPTAWTGSGSQWHLGAPQNPGFETYPSFRRLIPATAGRKHRAPPVMTVMFPVSAFNHFEKNAAQLDIEFHGPDSERAKLKFAWLSKNPGDKKDSLHTAAIDHSLVWLGHQKRWLLNSAPSEIGLQLEPGNYCVDLKGPIKLINDAPLKPDLLVDGKPKSAGDVLVYANRNAKLSWDTDVPTCASIMIVISKPDQARLHRTIYSGKILDGITNISNHGVIHLYELTLPPGLSQIQVRALNAAGDKLGFPSEPITVLK